MGNYNINTRYKNMTPGVKASLWFMTCSILQKGISFSTMPIFIRLLSSGEYGDYSVFLSWESIISIFVTLNLSYQVFNNGMVKYDKDKDSYTTSMVGLTFCAGGVAWLVYCLFNGFFQRYIELRFEYMGLMFFDMLFTATIGLWTVRQRYEFKYKALTIVTLANTVLNPVLGVILVTTLEDKVYARLVSIVASNFLVFVIVFIALLRNSRKIISFPNWKYALKLDLPLIPHYLSMVLLNNSDRIMISKLCGSAYTAFYSVAYNAAMVMQIVVASVNASFNPWLYQQLKEKNYSKIRKTTNYLLLLVALVTVIPVLFAPEVILILGSEEYASAVNIMPALSCCVFLMYIYTLFSNIEMFYERPKFIMIGSLSATVINIILNYIFIQLFGYEAAAYTTLVCYILLALFHYLMMVRVCKEQRIAENIYNLHFIMALTGGVMLIAFAISRLYSYAIIRYTILASVFLIVIIQRKKVLAFWNKMKQE